MRALCRQQFESSPLETVSNGLDPKLFWVCSGALEEPTQERMPRTQNHTMVHLGVFLWGRVSRVITLKLLTVTNGALFFNKRRLFIPVDSLCRPSSPPSKELIVRYQVAFEQLVTF